MGTPHKWAKEIHAWADGEEIQYQYRNDPTWRNVAHGGPIDWDNPHCTFRIKPKLEERYLIVSAYLSPMVHMTHGLAHNAMRPRGVDNSGDLGIVRVLIDPDTKKLLKAEVV